jgi:hypothetical protein
VPLSYVNEADLNHYAFLGVFGQFILEIKPMREIRAINATPPMINQKYMFRALSSIKEPVALPNVASMNPCALRATPEITRP